MLGFVGISSALASGVIWPDLPKDGHIVGRTATLDDVKAGNAAFAAIGKNGERLSTPVSLEIPQYGVRVEAGNGMEILIIVIQAEETPAGKTIGYRMLGNAALGVCMLAEVHLLGRKKPS